MHFRFEAIDFDDIAEIEIAGKSLQFKETENRSRC